MLVGTAPDLLKKENGYPARILNGLWALCELAGVERISQSGKVLGDEASWPIFCAAHRRGRKELREFSARNSTGNSKRAGLLWSGLETPTSY